MDQTADRFGLRASARAIRLALAALAALTWSVAARAENYLDNSDSAIVDSTNCAVRTTRVFTISDTRTISDLNVGIVLAHSYRADLRISLTHSQGGVDTTVALMTNVTDGSNNLNVLFDDEAAQSITSHTGQNDTATTEPASATTAYSYQRNFRPQSSLNDAFAGRAMNGTWTLSICDSFASDTGTLRSVQLIFTNPPPLDLGVSKSDGVASVMSGGSTTYIVEVVNAGTASVTGAILRDPAATGMTKAAAQCAPTPGACTPSSTPTIAELEAGYALPTLAPGQSYRLAVTVTITAAAGSSVTNSATIADPAGNPDAITGNNSASDINSVTTRVAQTPPPLLCPAGSTARPYNWQPSSWPAGSTSNVIDIPYVGPTQVGFSLSGGAWAPKTSIGTMNTPYVSSALSFGLTPNPTFLIADVDFSGPTQFMTATYVLPTAVPGAQFQLYDIDYSANAWADMVRVSATFQGQPVPVTLSSGVANYVIGDTFYGDGASSDTQANGNGWVTIGQPFDTITFTYGNHTRIQTIANPAAQFIAWGGFSKLCDATTTITVAKSSEVVESPFGGAGARFATPAARVRYCILVTNSGSGTATAVTASDVLPAATSFVAGSMRSGTSCATATSVEDDDNAGADESDPFGMSFGGTTATARAATLAPGATAAFTFEATIN